MDAIVERLSFLRLFYRLGTTLFRDATADGSHSARSFPRRREVVTMREMGACVRRSRTSSDVEERERRRSYATSLRAAWTCSVVIVLAFAMAAAKRA